MTDAEKVEALRSAIVRADRILDWILEDPMYPESMITTAKRVRRILRAGLQKIEADQPAKRSKTKLPAQNFKPWQINGLIKETRK